MNKLHFSILLILALVVIAGFGMDYKNKNSESASLAPAIFNNCGCGNTPKEILVWRDGKPYYQGKTIKDCPSQTLMICSILNCEVEAFDLDYKKVSDVTLSFPCRNLGFVPSFQDRNDGE